MLKTNQHVRWGTSLPLPMDIQQLGGHPTQGCWLSWWYRLILIVNISEAEFLSFIYKINRNSFCPASRGHQLHPWGVWTQLWMLISNNRYLSFLSFFFFPQYTWLCRLCDHLYGKIFESKWLHQLACASCQTSFLRRKTYFIFYWQRLGASQVAQW